MESTRAVRLTVNDAPLEGCLSVPDGAAAVVVLVNGGWGSRYASRESKLAVALQRRGFGTLTVDLLTPREDGDRARRFATDSLAGRLAGVTDWLDCQDRTAGRPRGLLGVGPGAVTALRTVDRFETGVGAVVGLLGGFEGPLDDVGVPTLLVSGSGDRPSARLGSSGHEVVVLSDGENGRPPGPRRVEPLTVDWFETHL